MAENHEQLGLDPSIKELLEHLSKDRKSLANRIAEQNTDLLPKQFSKEDSLHLADLESRRVREIDHLVNLLLSNSNDEEVKKMAEGMNQLYREKEELSKIVPNPTTTAIEIGKYESALASGDQRYIDAFNARKSLEERLVVKMESNQSEHINLVFRDVLRNKRVGTIVDDLVEGDPVARRKMMLTTMELYGDIQDHILTMPKSVRDQELQEFEKTIFFYKALLNGETKKEWAQRIKQKIVDTSKDSNKASFRDLIYKGKNKLQDFGIKLTSMVFGGDDESVITYSVQKAADLERAMSRPVKPNDPEVLSSIEKEVNEMLDSMTQGIDGELVDRLMRQSVRLRSLPDNYLSKEDSDEFSGTFKEFIHSIVLPIQQNIVSAHESLINKAYQYSHGENSMMNPDSLFRAKIAQKQGIDLKRTLQLFSPFRAALPDGVKLKPFKDRFNDYEKSLTAEQKESAYMSEYVGMFQYKITRGWDNFSNVQKEKFYRENANGGVDKVTIKSNWDTGFWKEHQVLSFVAQTATAAVTYKAGEYALRGAAWAAARAPYLRYVVPKVMPPWVGRMGRVGGQAYVGYLMGDWINNKILESMDESITRDFEDNFEKYGSVKEFPEDLKSDLRSRILRNELQRRRGYFQGVGYDVSKIGMKFLDAAYLGAEDGGWSPFRDSMVKTGAFREALIAANEQLNMVGLEPFTVE